MSVTVQDYDDKVCVLFTLPFPDLATDRPYTIFRTSTTLNTKRNYKKAKRKVIVEAAYQLGYWKAQHPFSKCEKHIQEVLYSLQYCLKNSKFEHP